MRETDINQIKVVFSDGKEISVHEGISLLELSYIYNENKKTAIVAGKVDNDIKELSHHLNDSCKIEFIDLTNSDGMRIYKRSTYFILIKAFYDLFPDRKVAIHHPISRGVYCEITGKESFNEKDLIKLEKKMKELVDQKIPFIKRIISARDAKEMFNKMGRDDRFKAIEYRKKAYVTLYSCDGYEDYFYGYMAPHTGYIKVFSVILCQNGIILRFPDKTDPNKLAKYEVHEKLFNIFKEYKKWNKILGVENVGALNDIVQKKEENDLIRVAEAFHEKKVAQIADLITEQNEKKRMVLIAGPSSSGKTTFAKRLSIQLRVNGYKPVIISLDDYFVNREHTPLDENGELDFEALEAIDVDLFNDHLARILNGEEVLIPKFNFHSGCREKNGKRLKMDKKSIIVIEGIHGLNEKLTVSINKKYKYKIYVSALTSMNIDDHNRIPTTDTRVIRRIVRDFSYRGCDAINTIKRWPSVRRGEEKNIFPFQEEADIMFNSFLIYEQGVLKTKAEPLLREIYTTNGVYSEAKRLIEFLSYFLPIDNKEIPINSILREFIGGSCFYK